MEDVFRTTDKGNRHDEDGREILNPTPMQPPLGYSKAPSLAEQIRQQVRAYKALDDTEPETEEEADDFEIEDDPMPESRWENDMIPSIKEVRARARELQKQAKLYARPPEDKSRTGQSGDQSDGRQAGRSREPTAEASRSDVD